MGKGNVNGALRLLTNNMSNGALPLSNATLQVLHLKHPELQEAHTHNEVLLQDLVKQFDSIVFDDIGKALVMKVAIKPKGGCGPSAPDADNWCRRQVYESFSSCPLDLRKSFSNFIKNLCITTIHGPITLLKVC